MILHPVLRLGPFLKLLGEEKSATIANTCLGLSKLFASVSCWHVAVSMLFHVPWSAKSLRQAYCTTSNFWQAHSLLAKFSGTFFYGWHGTQTRKAVIVNMVMITWCRNLPGPDLALSIQRHGFSKGTSYNRNAWRCPDKRTQYLQPRRDSTQPNFIHQRTGQFWNSGWSKCQLVDVGTMQVHHDCKKSEFLYVLWKVPFIAWYPHLSFLFTPDSHNDAFGIVGPIYFLQSMLSWGDIAGKHSFPWAWWTKWWHGWFIAIKVWSWTRFSWTLFAVVPWRTTGIKNSQNWKSVKSFIHLLVVDETVCYIFQALRPSWSSLGKEYCSTQPRAPHVR